MFFLQPWKFAFNSVQFNSWTPKNTKRNIGSIYCSSVIILWRLQSSVRKWGIRRLSLQTLGLWGGETERERDRERDLKGSKAVSRNNAEDERRLAVNEMGKEIVGAQSKWCTRRLSARFTPDLPTRKAASWVVSLLPQIRLRQIYNTRHSRSEWHHPNRKLKAN